MNIMLKRHTAESAVSKQCELSALFIGAEQCASAHSFGPYIRDCFLIHYCISGKGVFNSPQGKFKVSPGEFFVICPGDVTLYSADSADPWQYVWVGFSGTAAERLREMPPVIEYAHDTFLRLNEMISERECSYEYCMSLLWEFFSKIGGRNADRGEPISGIRTFIKYNYMNEITVESIAERAHLDRRYLSREYKKRFGRTIRDELIRTRINAACRFLSAGYSVGASAKMAGYADVFNFSKMFKKLTGRSPREYAKDSKTKNG